VLVFSERNAVSRKWHALQYEFEDVAVECGLAELVAPAARVSGTLSRAYYRISRAAGRPFASTGLEEITVTGDYDLFFAYFAFPTDIPHIQHARDWRSRCRKAIAFLGEFYTHDIEANRANLSLLARMGFDRVFVLNTAPAAAIQEIVRCPVEFLPLGVDAFRFSPHPLDPPRVVDLYQFGRRSDVTHDAAVELARQDGLYYVYDTIFNVPVPDYRPHREMIAETMKRSRYFFAYRAGENQPRAKQDDVLSARYFEGIAGGAVLLGSRPGVREYDECFPWPDATITIPFEARDLREILADLDAQPARLATARMHNVVETLRRHDWAYRWRVILERAGLPPAPGLQERFGRLEALAELAHARESAALEQLA
jgi:Glycosyl transferases group 1